MVGVLLPWGFGLGANPGGTFYLHICVTNSHSFSSPYLLLIYSGRSSFITLFYVGVYCLLHLQEHVKSLDIVYKFIITVYYLSSHSCTSVSHRQRSLLNYSNCPNTAWNMVNTKLVFKCLLNEWNIYFYFCYQFYSVFCPTLSTQMFIFTVPQKWVESQDNLLYHQKKGTYFGMCLS